MYSTEEKQKAIQAYLENNCNAAKTILQLGYPTIPSLLSWAKANNCFLQALNTKKCRMLSQKLQREIPHFCKYLQRSFYTGEMSLQTYFCF